jgi:hypothetical protein
MMDKKNASPLSCLRAAQSAERADARSDRPKVRHKPHPRAAREYIDALLVEEITVVENGIPRRVTTFEVILMQLWMREMAGDRRALSVRLKYQQFAASQRRPDRNPQREIIIKSV